MAKQKARAKKKINPNPKPNPKAIPDESDKEPDKVEGVKAKLTKSQAERMNKEDAGILKDADPKGSYLAVKLSGPDRFRLINKTRQIVSPVLSMTEAMRLESDLNMKDPEQKRYNLKKGPGEWSGPGVGPVVPQA